MARWFVTLLAAGSGAVYAFLETRRRLAATRNAIIHIDSLGGLCRARTEPARLRVQRLNAVRWTIEDRDGCLTNGAVEIRFERDDSPLFRVRPRDDGGRAPRPITDRVRLFVRDGVFKYEIWYVGPDASYQMEDPEMQIEY